MDDLSVFIHCILLKDMKTETINYKKLDKWFSRIDVTPGTIVTDNESNLLRTLKDNPIKHIVFISPRRHQWNLVETGIRLIYLSIIFTIWIRRKQFSNPECFLNLQQSSKLKTQMFLQMILYFNNSTNPNKNQHLQHMKDWKEAFQNWKKKRIIQKKF